MFFQSNAILYISDLINKMAISHSQKEYFSSLVEASPMPMAIYKGEQIIISMANQAMLDLWAKDPTIIGKTFSQALPELQGQPFLGLLQQVYQTGLRYDIKEQRVDLMIDGQVKICYFNVTYKALKNTKGRNEAILHMATDVTELVLTRQQIAETQERLSFALFSAEIGTWDLDPVNNTVKWDARSAELFGFPEDAEINYEEALAAVHPLDQEMVAKSVQKAIDPNTTGHYDVRYRTITKIENQVRWVHCKGKAYFHPCGTAYRFAGTVQDITKEVKNRQREQQLLSLVAHNADHMSVADMNGNLIYMNQAARKMLGVEPEMDVTKLSANNFYTHQELKRVQQQVILEIKEENGWQGTIRLMNRKTKEVIPCHVNYILIKDTETGEVIGRGATARDLRAEIKAKAELRRLATIVDISEDFCNYCDLNGDTIYVNEAGTELIGIDKNNMSVNSMYQYHSGSSSRLMKKEIMPELLSTGRWSGPLQLVHQQTGEIIPVYKQLFLIREEFTNEPVAIAGIARDMRPELNARKVLDRKNTELSQAVKELEFLANAVPAVVWTSKPDGQLDYINERWQERSAKTIQESLGSGWVNVVHQDDLQQVFVTWEDCLKTGNPYQAEFRMLDNTGEYRWWLMRALALKNEDGKIVKWYGSNTDINEQKEVQRQKDNFLGVASHELKTPVTSIKAYAQVMEMMFRRSGDIKNAELLAKMDNQVNKLNHLIADLLDVTKINTGRLQFNEMPFDFNQMVEEVTEEVQRTTGKHLIKKQLNFKRDFRGDKERICQVVSNLLTNAIKYSPDADRIIIYTEDHGNEVQLCVQDFGIGISREKQDKVFEQFYRVSGTKQHTFPGLGLGLYISSEIVKYLKGRIWVNSVEGKGSTFCFALPLKPETIK